MEKSKTENVRIKGIDVSGYNTISSYDGVAADNVDFAIIKIIRRDLQPDKLFEKHWKGFEDARIPIQGVYNYSYATYAGKFRSDAKRVLEVLDGRQTMVWLDIEDKSLAGLGAKLVDGIRTYADVILNAGMQFGVYTYLSFYNSYLRRYADKLNDPFWLARYPSSQPIDNNADPNNKSCPDIGKKLYGWQYSSKGIVDGIKGFVDLDEWYVSIEADDDASVVQSEVSYINDGFRAEMARLLGLPVNVSVEDILAATVTISAKTNKHHPTVTALERLLKEHGYYTGEIEADMGKRPIFGNGMAKGTALYQTRKVGLRVPDKEWTAGKRSYKTALNNDN